MVKNRFLCDIEKLRMMQQLKVRSGGPTKIGHANGGGSCDRNPDSFCSCFCSCIISLMFFGYDVRFSCRCSSCGEMKASLSKEPVTFATGMFSCAGYVKMWFLPQTGGEGVYRTVAVMG